MVSGKARVVPKCVDRYHKKMKYGSYLAQSVLPGDPWRAIALHQPGCEVSISVGGGAHPHVASAFLHDDTENHALLYNDFGAFQDSIPNASDIFASVASLKHLRLIDVEDFLKGLPLRLGREVGRGAGVPSETHSDDCDLCIVCILVIVLCYSRELLLRSGYPRCFCIESVVHRAYI